MAVSFVSVGALTPNGSTSTTSISITPALPGSILSGDRVFCYVVSSALLTTPTDWDVAISALLLGTGAISAAAGQRYFYLFYRDYNGVWTAPVVSTVSAAAPSLAGACVGYRKAATEVWEAPIVFGSGSDTTSGTGFSITTGTMAFQTGAYVHVFDGFPTTPTSIASQTLTASGVTFTSLTIRNALNGSTTGNDAYADSYNASVTTGATATATHGLTLGAAMTGGAVIFQIGVSPGKSPPPPNPQLRLRPYLVR